MAQSISQEAIGATGLPGATAASRHAGATASGAPTTGTFAVGDYVVDQTGAMYVCTVAGTPGTWQLSGVSVNENIAGKNFVINGGMDIWQRGTSFALSSSLAYTADRWVNYSSTPTTVSQIASGLTGFQYALRVQRNSGSSATSYIPTVYNMESKNSYPLAGQTVTLSFWARAGANYSSTSNLLNIFLQSGTGTDQNQYNGYYTGSTLPVNTTLTLTTSWQRFTYTCAIPSNSTQVGFEAYYTPTGTAGTNDYFDITGVQLEIAPQATPFSRAGGSIGGELALCQRYYYQMSGSNGTGGIAIDIASGQVFASNQIDFMWQFPVTMRAIPSISASSGTNYFIAYTYYTLYYVNTISAAYDQSIYSSRIRIAPSGAVGGQGAILGTQYAAAYVAASAEL